MKVPEPRLFAGHWTHLFGPDRAETLCRIVIDATNDKLIAAQASKELKWSNLSASAKADLADSLFNANDVGSAPAEHGLEAIDSLPEWAKDLTATTAEPMFKPGDVVCWTNDYGVKWRGRRVIEVDTPDKWGNRYYLEPTDAPWMYVRENNLAHESMGRSELENQLQYDSSLQKHCARHPHYLNEISTIITARNQRTA